MRIILINGKKRSGKDYLAFTLKTLIEETVLPKSLNKRVGIYRFADRLKEIMCTTLNIDLETLDDYKNKEEDVMINGKNVTNVRKILQTFGTDAMKPIFGNDIWVELLYNEIKSSNCSKDKSTSTSIISDWRYMNEYEYLKNQKDCEIIKIRVINRDILNIDKHSSENELNDMEFDYEVDNTGYKLSKEKLNDLVKKIMNPMDKEEPWTIIKCFTCRQDHYGTMKMIKDRGFECGKCYVKTIQIKNKLSKIESDLKKKKKEKKKE